MESTDWTMLVAVALSPIVAVQVSQWLDRQREKHRRREALFRTLMATRGQVFLAVPDVTHVQALNSIEIEFYGSRRGDHEVIEAWKIYLEHLGTDAKDGGWDDKAKERYLDLLQKVAKALDYDFDKSHLMRLSYFPVGWGRIGGEQEEVRKLTLELLKGARPLRIHQSTIV